MIMLVFHGCNADHTPSHCRLGHEHRKPSIAYIQCYISRSVNHCLYYVVMYILKHYPLLIYGSEVHCRVFIQMFSAKDINGLSTVLPSPLTMAKY